MRKIPILLSLCLVAAVFFSCNSRKIENLEAEKARMHADSITKDSLLNDFFNTFNDIEDNLAEITGRQKYIANAAVKEDPRDPDVRDRIRMEIATINDILLENDQRLTQLIEQLKSSAIKIKALEETLAILSKRVEEKDLEIAILKDKLSQLNIEKENLNKTLAQLKQESQKQQEMLQAKDEEIDQNNTVWYVVGTSKYLKDNEIIEKTGMLRSSKQLNDQVKTGLFTEGDQRSLNAIPVNSDKATLITIHPEGSYELIKEGKVITSLNILKPDEFWKTSRFCVIETK